MSEVEERRTPEKDPLERQRERMALLSQETRHDIIQALLGHPEHLASEDEIDYYVHDKSKGAVQDGIERLVEEDILDLYEHPPNVGRRDYPHNFYGFTEYGIEILDRYNLLKGVPFVRALHDNARKSQRVERHESAPRPDLPAVVAETLVFDEDGGSGDIEPAVRHVDAADPEPR